MSEQVAETVWRIKGSRHRRAVYWSSPGNDFDYEECVVVPSTYLSELHQKVERLTQANQDKG